MLRAWRELEAVRGARTDGRRVEASGQVHELRQRGGGIRYFRMFLSSGSLMRVEQYYRSFGKNYVRCREPANCNSQIREITAIKSAYTLPTSALKNLRVVDTRFLEFENLKMRRGNFDSDGSTGFNPLLTVFLSFILFTRYGLFYRQYSVYFQDIV